MWRIGDRVAHRFNRSLGTGRVAGLADDRVVVEFPWSGETLSFAATTDALQMLSLAAGIRARDPQGVEVVIEDALPAGTWRVDDGRILPADQLWPLAENEDPLQAMAEGQVGSLEDFRNLLDALRLQRVREAGGLGSFLGGRIRLYPHQLHAAERACARDPVRWLLADGVGLGKTVEACLIMNHLIHTGRAQRVLVVAPESLTVQWLGEMWRKHHQVFSLVDDHRLQDVVREQEEDGNPFDVTDRAIVALETLCDETRLVGMATRARIDLLVVDEAHHLQRSDGHPGNLAYRALAPIVHTTPHVLLLTATPLEDDALGFMRLLQLLEPASLPEGTDLLARLEERTPLPPCTSATRAADIGGWPPRLPVPVDLDDAAWRPLRRLERLLRARPATNEVERANKATLVARAASSAPALEAKLKAGDQQLRAMARAVEDDDPRVDWLVAEAPGWRAAGEKSLVFVAHRETLDLVKRALETRAHLRVGIFHEELSTKRRDIEVAQLRLADGPSLLVSTECGGEGRNFEMCDRLVLFDLPWHPGVVEQRIGRLDRIGRDRPTQVVYFRPPDGLGGAVVKLYEELGVFRASVGGLDRELKHIAREVARAASDGGLDIHPGFFAEVLGNAREARTRVQEAAYHELHAEPYHESLAAGILARVPGNLEELTAAVVLRAAARFGLDVEQQRGQSTWYIGLGTESLVGQLPGVPDGASIIGTFSREEAVAMETIDFLSAGHPLVEGILNELLLGPHGRTACFEIDGAAEGFGLLAVVAQQGRLEAFAVDATGRALPDLARRLVDGSLVMHPVDHRQWTALPEWATAIRGMAKHLPHRQPPRAVAAFRIRRG